MHTDADTALGASPNVLEGAERVASIHQDSARLQAMLRTLVQLKTSSSCRQPCSGLNDILIGEPTSAMPASGTS